MCVKYQENAGEREVLMRCSMEGALVSILSFWQKPQKLQLWSGQIVTFDTESVDGVASALAGGGGERSLCQHNLRMLKFAA